MPDPTFKIDSTTVLSKSGTTVSIDSGLNIKPAFSALDSSASNGPTSGTAITKSTTLPLFGIRAWVNFNGDSVTSISSEDCCAISASGNISKVVRTATGTYTVHFTTAMPDANYVVSGLGGGLFGGSGASNGYLNLGGSAAADSTTSFLVSTQRTDNDGAVNASKVSLIVVR